MACQKTCGLKAQQTVEPCTDGCICPDGIQYCPVPKVCEKPCGKRARMDTEPCVTNCLCSVNTEFCPQPYNCPKPCGVTARKSGRKKGQITNCKHIDLPVYALGMCNHCYHKFGRSSYATDCKHAGERLAYAKGKCQNCYINDYNKAKRREKKLLDKAKNTEDKT